MEQENLTGAEAADRQESVSVRKKLLLGDDHQMVIEALRTLLEQDYEVAIANSSDSFLEHVKTFQPDIAVLDINMPEQNGFAIAKKALELRPELPVVFLSMHDGTWYQQSAAEAGARGLLSKLMSAKDVLACLRDVLDGKNLLAETVAGAPAARREALTTRQLEVLRLIASGATAKDIANDLAISVRTAEFHRAAIMQRLNLHSSAQMTRYAISNGIC